MSLTHRNMWLGKRKDEKWASRNFRFLGSYKVNLGMGEQLCSNQLLKVKLSMNLTKGP